MLRMVLKMVARSVSVVLTVVGSGNVGTVMALAAVLRPWWRSSGSSDDDGGGGGVEAVFRRFVFLQCLISIIQKNIDDLVRN